MSEVLKKLFGLPKSDLFFILKEICGDDVPSDLFEDTSNVVKEIINDEPKVIRVTSWDMLTINHIGISILKKGHGESIAIAKFNKFFTLDNILAELAESKKPKFSDDFETVSPKCDEAPNDFGDSVSKVNLPDGTYDAVWGGYSLVIMIGINLENPYNITTKVGVKGFNIKVQAQVTSGSLKIITK